MNLLIDIGNERVKWAALSVNALGEVSSQTHRDNLDAAFACLERDVRALAPARILVANVAGEQARSALLRAVAAADGPDPSLLESASQYGDVRNAYPDARDLGVDRWLSLLGARRRQLADFPLRPVIAIGAGTAVTLDMLAADGTHQGGLIWPSPRLQAKVLSEQTDGISQFTARADYPGEGDAMLARSTADAVGRAAWVGVAAGIDRLVRACAMVQDAVPRILLAGGSGAQLEAWLEHPVELVPHLVLEGIAVIAEEATPNHA